MPLLDGLLGSTVQADGVALPQRGAVNFIGARVIDSASTDSTDVDLTGSGPADVITENATPVVLFSLPVADVGISVYEVTIAVRNSTPRAYVWGPFVVSAGKDAGVARFTSGDITNDIPEVGDSEVAVAVFSLDENGPNVDIRGTGIAATTLTWTVRVRKLI